MIWILGGVVAAGLAIVAARQSYGPFMAAIQGIMAVVLVVNGVAIASEEPVGFGIAAVIFLAVTGYYFVPVVFSELTLESKTKTLQLGSDLEVIFRRPLDSDESRVVQSWLSVFGRDDGLIKRITTAPRLDAANFAEDKNSLCVLQDDEVPIMHIRLWDFWWTHWPWERWTCGILLTSRRMYLRAYNGQRQVIDYESARQAVGGLQRDTWFTKLAFDVSWEDFDGIQATELKDAAEPFLELLQRFLGRVH